MKLPLSWIKELVPTKTSPEELADKLTQAGIKVEAVHHQGDEAIFEFELTTNRGDEQGVLGIAREVAAIENLELTKDYPTFSNVKTKKLNFKNDPSLLLAYTYVVIENIQIKPSSQLIQDRLSLSGGRALANVIDVTSYVMLETGIPLHSFDLDKISGQMTVRTSRDQEKIITLDSKLRELPPGAIIIEDEEKIFDLAGIMGSQNSEVDQETKNILLFVPIFSPVRVRRASKTLNLRTEASARFEKDLDLLSTEWIANFATDLLLKEAGGKAISKFTYQPKVKEKLIKLGLGELNRRVGFEFNQKEVTEILIRLNFRVTGKGHDLSIEPPSYRPDVTTTEDLIEEVTRIYGFNKLPQTLLDGELPTHHYPNWPKKIRAVFVSLGFSETLTPTLVSQDFLNRANIDFPTIELTNPMSTDYAVLRSSLLPQLLKQAAFNLPNFQTVSLFEVGKIFSPTMGEFELPVQPEVTSAVTTQDLLYLKGVVENLARQLNIKSLVYEETNQPYLKAGGAYAIKIANQKIGEIGTVNQAVLASFDLETTLNYLSFDNQALVSHYQDTRYQPLPKYPEVKEDLSVLVKADVKAGDIERVIRKASDLVHFVQTTDVYQGANIDVDKKSLTFEVNYYSDQGTLTDQVVAKERIKILKALKHSFKAEIR